MFEQGQIKFSEISGFLEDNFKKVSTSSIAGWSAPYKMPNELLVDEFGQANPVGLRAPEGSTTKTYRFSEFRGIVKSELPVISSTDEINIDSNTNEFSFSYTIVASNMEGDINSPFFFSTKGLPNGLTLNSGTGLISGTINLTELGHSSGENITITFTVFAVNYAGPTSKEVTLNIAYNSAPVITVIGDLYKEIFLGSSYIDQGATAYDAEDGDLTTSINTENDVDSNSIGTYQVFYTVSDSKGLESSALRVVVVKGLLVSVSLTSNVLCKGESTGSLAGSVPEAVGAITYAWKNTSNNQVVSTNQNPDDLPAGTYTLTAIDSLGATGTSSEIEITEPIAKLTITSIDIDYSVISVTVAVDTHVLCKGESTGSATGSASGGTEVFSSYSWKNTLNNQEVSTDQNASNLPAGTYKLTVTDSLGATATSSEIQITEPAEEVTITSIDIDYSAISVTVAVDTHVLCKGESTGSATGSASGGTEVFSSYSWKNTSNNQEVSTDQNASNLPAGTYKLTVTDSSGATATSSEIQITEPAEEVTITSIDIDYVAPSNYQFDWENNKHWRSEEFVLDPHADMGEGYVHYERNFYDFTSSTEVTFTMIFHMYMTAEKATELGMVGYEDGMTRHQIAYDLTGTYTVDPLNGIMSADFSSSSWHKLIDTFTHTTRTDQGNDLDYNLDVSQEAVNAGSTTGIVHFDDNPQGGPQPLGTSITGFERVNHPAHIDSDSMTFPTMAFSYPYFEEGFGESQQT